MTETSQPLRRSKQTRGRQTPPTTTSPEMYFQSSSKLVTCWLSGTSCPTELFKLVAPFIEGLSAVTKLSALGTRGYCASKAFVGRIGVKPQPRITGRLDSNSKDSRQEYLCRILRPANSSGSKPMKTNLQNEPKDGDQCSVVGGTHKGKSGTVRDINTSKTGHITITVCSGRRRAIQDAREERRRSIVRPNASD